MEMNQIRYFLAVCDHRNFTHAARATHVSQPSLTAAIKKLEAELGGPLFLRDRAGCRLTSLGALVRPKLKNIHDEAQNAKVEALRHVRLDRVPISVGVGETVGCSRIVEAFEGYRAQRPEVEIELIVLGGEALLEGLREGRFDFAISSMDASPDLYRIDPLYTEGYRAVVANSHALSDRTSVPLDELAMGELLDRPNCEMRDDLHEACASLGHTLYASYRSNRVDWLLQMVRSGAGASVLPESAIPNDPNLHTLEIEGITIKRKVNALRYRHQAFRKEADQLIRSLAA